MLITRNEQTELPAAQHEAQTDRLCALSVSPVHRLLSPQPVQKITLPVLLPVSHERSHFHGA